MEQQIRLFKLPIPKLQDSYFEKSTITCTHYIFNIPYNKPTSPLSNNFAYRYTFLQNCE